MAELVKQKMAAFRENPTIKTWLEGSNLKPQTQFYYVKRLYYFFDGKEDPKTFLDRALKDQRATAIELKGRIAKIVTEHGAAAGFHTKAALQNLMNYYEIGIHLNGKIKLRRKWKKEYFTWETAERIVSRCREPYQTCFRFMLSTGLGCDEFLEINNSPKIQAEIAKQLADTNKDFVIIDLEPRKSTLSRYFVAVPRKLLPQFPVKSLDYGGSGHQPITRELLESRWRSASLSLNLHKLGQGPHSLRSAFRSQCAKAGVSESVAEFCMGHGSSDEYGYERQVLDEKYVVRELSKLWSPATITQSDVTELQEKVKRQDETIEMLRSAIAQLQSAKKTKR